MNKTYSEQRQEAYFKAARAMFAIAVQVLDDDTTQAAEFLGSTDRYVQNQSKITMDMGAALENLGHEQCMASTRQENLLYKARQAHSDAVTRYIERRTKAQQDAMFEAVGSFTYDEPDS